MAEATPVLIPQENVNDESVILLTWCVANGTQVHEGQELAEVEGSKAVFAIPAPVAGIVQYTIEAGQEIAVGAILCTIYSTAVAAVGSHETAAPDPTPASPLPDGQNIAPEGQLPARTPDALPGTPRFSQPAAALLQQHGLDPQRFAGHGLVRTSEVLAMLEPLSSLAPSPLAGEGWDGGTRGRESARTSASSDYLTDVLGGNGTAALEPASPHTADAPIPVAGVPFRRVPLARSKQTEIRYLAAAYHHTLPSVVTVAVPTRGWHAAAAQCPYAPGSPTAIVLFEVARLLRHYPLFNACYTDGAAHLYEAVNVGFALDAGHGLKVPVIHQADTKSLPEITSEMQALLRRYLDNTLRVDDLVAGTFTITDLSSEGVLTFHPLINQGQSAILGIGSEYSAGLWPAEGFFTLILAFDHQLTEGRQAAQFLQELGRRLQAYEAAMRTQTPDTSEPHCARCLTSLSRLRQLEHGQPGGHFLVQTIEPDGTQAYRCSLCMQGW